MPQFYILRVHREDNPADRRECQVKFFPIGGKRWITLEAETEAEAFTAALARFPSFRCHLAVQECFSYDRIIETLGKLRRAATERPADRERPRIIAEGLLRIAATADPRTETPSPNRPSEPSRDTEISSISYF